MALPTLVTQRLILRPFAEADIDELHALWTDPDVRRFLWDDVVIPRDRAVEVVRAAIALAQQEGLGHWTARLRETDALIGECGFSFFGEPREVELFYSQRKDCWGRGLAAEAARAAIDYLWSATGFTRVWGRTDAPNEASVRLMRRLGMRLQQDGSQFLTYVLEKP
jgi:ribosomal-protein-alanine N-acetyltransferase